MLDIKNNYSPKIWGKNKREEYLNNSAFVAAIQRKNEKTRKQRITTFCCARQKKQNTLNK